MGLHLGLEVPPFLFSAVLMVSYAYDEKKGLPSNEDNSRSRLDLAMRYIVIELMRFSPIARAENDISVCLVGHQKKTSHFGSGGMPCLETFLL